MSNFASKFVLPLVALAMLAFGVFHMLKAQQELPKPPPPIEPARNPFGRGIAGSGIVESQSENIAIGSALPGVVLEVFMPSDRVGTQVAAGEPLFRVDDRQLRARLASQQAELAAAEAQLARLESLPRPEEIPPAEAQVKAAEANVLRLKDQYDRAQKLLASNSIGLEEHNTRQRMFEEAQQQAAQARAQLALLTAGAWEPDKAIARATVAEKQAQVAETEVEIGRTLVRAPVAGQILQVNVRPGEYVSAAAGQALVVLGNLDRLRVRVDIDEHDIPRFQAGAPAKAFLRGPEREEIALRFVRVEPYVVPKRSLTGNNTERVDTRVLQVIYEAADVGPRMFVGQQVDVYVNDAQTPATEPTTAKVTQAGGM